MKYKVKIRLYPNPGIERTIHKALAIIDFHYLKVNLAVCHYRNGKREERLRVNSGEVYAAEDLGSAEIYNAHFTNKVWKEIKRSVKIQYLVEWSQRTKSKLSIGELDESITLD